MATLSEYKSLDEKADYFSKELTIRAYQINTENEFDSWYSQVKKFNSTSHFFRGMSEAKYKLYTSAQRIWMENLKKGGEKKYYRKFFEDLMLELQKDPVMERVFNYYELERPENRFALMSLVQHYDGVTPFLDWSYDIDVALFFAANEIQNVTGHEINNYSSVYCIDNNITKINLLKPGRYKDFDEMLDSPEIRIGKNKPERKTSPSRLYYLAEVKKFGKKMGYNLSLFNQNIILQRGLFIFNPSRTIPLEEYNFSGNGSTKKKISCYNIHKNLSGYIRDKIAESKVTGSFIYPDVKNVIALLKNKAVAIFFK